MLRSKCNSHFGFSIVEIMVSMALIGIAAGLVYRYVGTLDKMQIKESRSKQAEQMKLSLLSNIRKKVELFKVSYVDDDDSTVNYTLDNNLGTIRWGIDCFAMNPIPSDPCSEAKGKASFAVVPMSIADENYRALYKGMYKLYIRFTHPEVRNGEPQDEMFLVYNF